MAESDSSTERSASPPWHVHLVAPTRAAERDPGAHWTAPPMVLKRPHTGRREVLAQTDDLAAAARWALSFGPEAEVKGPPALRVEVRRQAEQLARRHASPTNPTLPDERNASDS